VFLTKAEGAFVASTKLHGGISGFGVSFTRVTDVNGFAEVAGSGTVEVVESSDVGWVSIGCAVLEMDSAATGAFATLSSQPGGIFMETPHPKSVVGFGAGAVVVGFVLAAGLLRRCCAPKQSAGSRKRRVAETTFVEGEIREDIIQN
jgi:hypothetical protein